MINRFITFLLSKTKESHGENRNDVKRNRYGVIVTICLDRYGFLEYPLLLRIILRRKLFKNVIVDL